MGKSFPKLQKNSQFHGNSTPYFAMALHIFHRLLPIVALSSVIGRASVPTPAPAPPPSAPPPCPPVEVRSAGEIPPTAQREPTTPLSLYSIGQPTPEEQFYLELINRSRSDPPDEGLRFSELNDPDVQNAYSYFKVDLDAMVNQFAMIDPAPPLSFNARLIDAARQHSQDMFDNVYQGHTGTDGSTPGKRDIAAGYHYSLSAENVYSFAKSVIHGHVGLDVDWGYVDHKIQPPGMQDPPGHRNNIHNPSFREIGIGVVLGEKSNGTATVGPQIVTQDFGSQYNSPAFVTGVVYYDFNGNDFYDPGEGIGGVRVDVEGSSHYAITADSGGYAVPVETDGTKTVTFSSNGETLWSTTTTVDNLENVKVDYVPEYLPPMIVGPLTPPAGTPVFYSLSPVLGAQAYEWELLRHTLATGVIGAENGTVDVTPSVSSGYDFIISDIKKSGFHAFRLVHPVPEDQSFALNGEFRPGSNASIRFASRLGWATPTQVARLQISLDDGATWETIWSKKGTNTSGEGTFHYISVPLSQFADQPVSIRFVYDYMNGTYFYQTDSGVGWYVDDISFIDTEELDIVKSGQTSTTRFIVVLPSIDDFLLHARAQLPSHWLAFGPDLEVTASDSPPGTLDDIPAPSINISGNQVHLRWPAFPVGALLESSPDLGPGAVWTPVDTPPINLGGEFEVTLPASGPRRFYRLVTP